VRRWPSVWNSPRRNDPIPSVLLVRRLHSGHPVHAKGHFDLRYGIFISSADGHSALKQHENRTCFIDEINCGSLSKIFGELMMLIEPDKRGKQHAIPLACSQDSDDTFYIPENLYLVGAMNTADRSLAMVDYALRRRFAS
jgi:5-methylcytosine-specific restriction enzyme B